MNRTTLGIWALVFSFLSMAVMGFSRDDEAARAAFDRQAKPAPTRTNPSDPTPSRSPYKNPSDPTPSRSPYKNPSDPKSTPYKNPSDPKPSPR